jgi:hypothetical protein
MLPTICTVAAVFLRKYDYAFLGIARSGSRIARRVTAHGMCLLHSPPQEDSLEGGCSRRKYFRLVMSRSTTGCCFSAMKRKMRQIDPGRKCNFQRANLVPNRIAPVPFYSSERASLDTPHCSVTTTTNSEMAPFGWKANGVE